MRAFLKITGIAGLALLVVACGLHVSNSGQMPAPEAPPDTVRVATHNVHYILLNEKEGRWSVGDWERRKASLDDAFKAIGADIVAFQEMESFSRGSDGSVNLARDYLLERNPDYAAAAAGDWRTFPSTQPVFYRTDRFEVEDQGWFFFSDTPDVIYSRTFNGSYPAFASWVRFAPVRGGRAFTVVNLHFEFKSRSNRRLSAALVRERLAPLLAEGQPVFLVGDINERAGSAILKDFEAQGFAFAPVRGSTYHFDRGVNLFGAIDHIAATGEIGLAGMPVVLRQRFRGAWPSDHYPVFADFRLPE